jgi:hypothetical protein
VALAVIGGEMPAAHDTSVERSSVFHVHASVGLVATAIGALIALCVLVTKVLTGAPQVVGEDSLLRLSTVLIQTGAMLIGIGPLVSVVTRMFLHSRTRRY